MTRALADLYKRISVHKNVRSACQRSEIYHSFQERRYKLFYCGVTVKKVVQLKSDIEYRMLLRREEKNTWRCKMSIDFYLAASQWVEQTKSVERGLAGVGK